MDICLLDRDCQEYYEQALGMKRLANGRQSCNKVTAKTRDAGLVGLKKEKEEAKEFSEAVALAAGSLKVPRQGFAAEASGTCLQSDKRAPRTLDSSRIEMTIL